MKILITGGATFVSKFVAEMCYKIVGKDVHLQYH